MRKDVVVLLLVFLVAVLNHSMYAQEAIQLVGELSPQQQESVESLLEKYLAVQPFLRNDRAVDTITDKSVAQLYKAYQNELRHTDILNIPDNFVIRSSDGATSVCLKYMRFWNNIWCGETTLSRIRLINRRNLRHLHASFQGTGYYFEKGPAEPVRKITSLTATHHHDYLISSETQNTIQMIPDSEGVILIDYSGAFPSFYGEIRKNKIELKYFTASGSGYYFSGTTNRPISFLRHAP